MTTGRDRIWYWLAGIAVAGGIVYMLRGILAPFVAGLLVAYFLDPLADRLERAGASRTLAVSLILVGFFALAAIALLLLLPPLQAQLVDLIGRTPEIVETARNRLLPLLLDFWSGLTPEEIDKLKGAAGSKAGDAMAWGIDLLKGVLSGGLALFGMLSLLVITPVVSFYLLRDWDRIVAWIDGFLPRDEAPTLRRLAGEIDTTLAAFIRGQASICLLLGIWYASGLTLIGLDFGLLVGMIAGVISFIPYVGASVGLAMGLGLAIFQFSAPLPVALVAAVFLIGQLAESYVLQPRIIGAKVGLHPVWLMFALLAGGALFGFTGVLLAVPVAAIIGVLIRHWLGIYRQSVFFTGAKDGI